MNRSTRALARSAVAIFAIACGCSANVMDLGHDEPVPGPGDQNVPSPGLEGSATLAPTRDLACPLSRPIEGRPCGVENGAPCTFVGGPEAPPDRDPQPFEESTTFCICTAERRWACLQGVTMKMLIAPLKTGDACESGLVVERGGETCRCVNGIARCER